MRIYVADTKDEMAYRAAEIIEDRLIKYPDTTLGLATGGTMIELYRYLVQMYERGIISFKSVVTFNLDEYVGIEPSHPASFRRFMYEYLFKHVDILPQNVHIPDGMAHDMRAECKSYDCAIKEHGGIDLQILGIGLNGHIGFNEPGTPFGTTTHVVDLTETTRAANAGFFGSIEDVPKQAVTMGIKNIMQSRSIILMASGEAKADMVAKALTGPITPQVPASVLQLHPQLTVILDRQAASSMPKDYFDCSFVA
ncbi:glucosamine-6-phosphate deaminase [Mahella sp.]|uniref:glucosamine-6-phosphate deaminase n=1 Tax=Mahella sp. TaxID=2798721 RepID=UPI0025C3D33E|nr:glucosamine-6-phosphate deaminase [Mahella sp.]MBZ4665890.1 glucosamine-6-phosphate isomerase [Mahella sp.]